jgi:hypothetical protein
MMQPVDTGSVEGALTLLYAAACLLGLVTLLMPMDPEIDISGQFAVALAAGVVAVGLHLARTLPRRGPMALVATGTVMTTAGIHFTAGVPSSASLFFLWIALFAFYFFLPRQAAAQMVLIGACYARDRADAAPVPRRRPLGDDCWSDVDGRLVRRHAQGPADAQRARGGAYPGHRPRRLRLGRRARHGPGLERAGAGHRFLVELTVSAGRRADGPVFHAFIRDVTKRRRTQQLLAAQYEVTWLLAEAPDWQHVEARLLPTLAAALDRPMAGLWIWQEELGALCCSRTWRAEAVEAQQFERVTRGMRLAPGVGLAGQVWSAARPVWVADVARDEHFLRTGPAVAAGLNSVVAFPVTHDGRVVAVVELYSQETRLPEGPLLDVLANIGAQIGQFLVRCRAEDDVAAQTRDLARVAEATRALARESDPERMAPAICATVREVAGTLTASLWCADGPDRLVNLAAAGLPEQVSLPAYLGSNAHGALAALRSGRPVFVPDGRGDPRCDAAMVEAIGCASVHFEPVVNGDGPLGCSPSRGHSATSASRRGWPRFCASWPARPRTSWSASSC